MWRMVIALVRIPHLIQIEFWVLELELVFTYLWVVRKSILMTCAVVRFRVSRWKYKKLTLTGG